MKNLVFKLPLIIGLVLISTNCSSDSDRDESPKTEKQDFTNANFIKSTMNGSWKMTHTNYNGSWSSVTTLPGTVQYESYYTFNDNSFTYKPYTNPTNNSLNESGSYVITPATTTLNASLKLNYTYNQQAKSRVIKLESYNNGIVEISETSILCPSGTCKERYQKQ